MTTTSRNARIGRALRALARFQDEFMAAFTVAINENPPVEERLRAVRAQQKAAQRLLRWRANVIAWGHYPDRGSLP